MLLQGIRELVPAQPFHLQPGAQASAPRTSVLASKTLEGGYTASEVLRAVDSLCPVNKTGKGDDLSIRRDCCTENPVIHVWKDTHK